MRYIAFRQDAINEIVTERNLQSGDFDEALNMIKIFKEESICNINRVQRISCKNGNIFISNDSSESHFLIFDVEKTELFTSNMNDFDLVTVFQKSFRFSLKYWNKSIFSGSEKLVGNNLAVIFPFPISRKRQYRLLFSLKPDAERLKKRDNVDNYLLAFMAAHQDGDEDINLANFRRFLKEHETKKHISSIDDSTNETEVGSRALSHIEMNAPEKRIDIHQNFETWKKQLTRAQKKFVTSPLDGPSRIEGPAGTGKTVSLCLNAVAKLFEAEKIGVERQILFITHSEASKKLIQTAISSMDGHQFITKQASKYSLDIETLQSFCGRILHQEVSDNEFIDLDAYDAKQLQILYVEDALSKAKKELKSFSKFMTNDFYQYILNEEEDLVANLIQHEIAVVIKGRAKENLDTYKSLPPLNVGLPVANDGDRSFIWMVYEKYRKQLISNAQFDTDDVVLSALGQLSTPIWRRRRQKEGFDMIFVDETHLFNMNELSILHHLTKDSSKFLIAFAVDKSQAIGDRGWNDFESSQELPFFKNDSKNDTKVETIFRCAPPVIDLAFSITSSGASLFTNFDNPLELSNGSMTYNEEKLAKVPEYFMVQEDKLVEKSFELADQMKMELSSKVTKQDIQIAIIYFENSLFAKAQRLASDKGLSTELIKRRGDIETVRKAQKNSSYLLSTPDYVGGLEFSGVVLVGVDEGRVPPDSTEMKGESKAYMKFVSHNRLYVAVTRAKYQVSILGSITRGVSPILQPALEQNFINYVQ